MGTLVGSLVGASFGLGKGKGGRGCRAFSEVWPHRPSPTGTFEHPGLFRIQDWDLGGTGLLRDGGRMARACDDVRGSGVRR